MPRFRRNNIRSAKLRPEQVITLRQEYEAGATQGELAQRYGLGVGQVGRIVRGEAWNALSTAAAPTAPIYKSPETWQSEADASMARLMADPELAKLIKP